MKHFGILLAIAVFGVALGASRPASAEEVGCLYNGGLHTCIWHPGYPYAHRARASGSSRRCDRASGDRPKRGGWGGCRGGGLGKLLRDSRKDVLAL